MSFTTGHTFTDIVTAQQLHDCIANAIPEQLVEAKFKDSSVTSAKIADGVVTPDMLDSAVIDKIWPVGTVHITLNATNPGTLLGVGTWVQFGEGCLLKSALSGGGTEDGSHTHTHTINNPSPSESTVLTAAQSGVPAHKHNNFDGQSWSYQQIGKYYNKKGTSVARTMSTYSTGATEGHYHKMYTASVSTDSFLPKSLCFYFWKRTA